MVHFCCDCQREDLPKNAFAKSQFKKAAKERRCRECALKRTSDETANPLQNSDLEKVPTVATTASTAGVVDEAPHVEPKAEEDIAPSQQEDLIDKTNTIVSTSESKEVFKSTSSVETDTEENRENPIMEDEAGAKAGALEKGEDTLRASHTGLVNEDVRGVGSVVVVESPDSNDQSEYADDRATEDTEPSITVQAKGQASIAVQKSEDQEKEAISQRGTRDDQESSVGKLAQSLTIHQDNSAVEPIGKDSPSNAELETEEDYEIVLLNDMGSADGSGGHGANMGNSQAEEADSIIGSQLMDDLVDTVCTNEPDGTEEDKSLTEEVEDASVENLRSHKSIGLVPEAPTKPSHDEGIVEHIEILKKAPLTSQKLRARLKELMHEGDSAIEDGKENEELIRSVGIFLSGANQEDSPLISVMSNSKTLRDKLKVIWEESDDDDSDDAVKERILSVLNDDSAPFSNIQETSPNAVATISRKVLNTSKSLTPTSKAAVREAHRSRVMDSMRQLEVLMDEARKVTNSPRQ